MSVDKKRCFVIAPIGPKDSDVRKRSDQILRHVIRPAVTLRGYTVERADEIDTPGSISNQIVNAVIEAELVIADLTGLNPNVMYELGIRHAARKPAIHILTVGGELPFDLTQHRTIFIDHQDLDSADECRDKIGKQIDAIESDPNAFDNPVTVAFNLSALHASDRPQDQSIADITESVQEIRRMLDSLTRTHFSRENYGIYVNPRHVISRTPSVQVDDLLYAAGILSPHGAQPSISPSEYLNLIQSAVSKKPLSKDEAANIRQAMRLLNPTHGGGESSTAYRELYEHTTSVVNDALRSPTTLLKRTMPEGY